MVSQKEVIELLRDRGLYLSADRAELANRIEAEGIAPPDGMVLVPSEPTAEMVLAAWDITDDNDPNSFSFTDGYKAMLAAAPKGVSDEQ